MAATASETLVDKPRGLVLAKYPASVEQGLESVLRALKSGCKRIGRALLRLESASTRADYAEVMRPIKDLVTQVENIEDKSVIPVDRIQGLGSVLKAIEPGEEDNNGEALDNLRQEVKDCFEGCGLTPNDIRPPRRQKGIFVDPAPMLREVSVVVKTCVDVTSNSDPCPPQTLREGDHIHFLLQRLMLAASSAPLGLRSQLFLQERRRHRWTKSGIQWRHLQCHEKFGDLPATTGEPVEVFIFDRPEDYVVAVVGQDPCAPDPPRDDLAIAIDITDDVHTRVAAHLPNSTFKYKWGPEEKAMWIGTPQAAGMHPFDCDLHVIVV